MAGEIDNLNFKVILNDKEFQATIDRDTRIAKKFNTTLSDLLDVKAKGKGVSLFSASTISDLNTIKKGVQEILDKMGGIKTKASEIKSEMKESGASMEMVKEKTAETKDLMGEVAKLTGIAFGAVQIKEFIGSLVRVSGEFETQKMALTSMLQSADDANMIFSTLRKNALESPYTFQDLTKYAKQLVAFNISTDKLIETEKMLADVAAGLDVDMGRIILAYGQVKAAGALKGQELRQFTEAGVPLLQSLADQIERTEGKAVSLAQVFNRISKKEIPFEMVEQAFKDMTAEGGKFYNMQEVLVETLKGKIGKLRDVWQQALYDMGNANSGYLKDAVDLITRLVANMDKIGGLIKAIIVQYGAFAAILATVASGINLVAGAKTLANFGNLVREIKAAEGAMNGLAIASKAAKSASFALAALATVGFLVYDAIKKANEAQTRFNKTIQENDKQLGDEIGKLDELYYRLRNAQKGTDDWNNAKAEAVQAYSKYDKNLADEIDRVGSLALSYDDLRTSIEEATRTRQLAAFEQQEQQAIEDANKPFLDKISKDLYKKYERAEAYMIMQEVQKAIRTGGSLQSILNNASIASLLERESTYYDYGGKTYRNNYLEGDISYLLEHNRKERENYLNNVRTLVKEYGLQGTPLDPDFNGPILGKTTGKGGTPSTWGNEGWQNGDKVSKEQKARIKTIMDLQSAYKDLKKSGYSEDEINQIIDKEFAWVDEKIRSRRDFWEELKAEADAMKDANAANSLRSDISKGQSKEAAEQKKAEIDAQKKSSEQAQKALDKYLDSLQKWMDSTQEVSGTGAAYGISRAIADYRKALAQNNTKFRDMAILGSNAYANDPVRQAQETGKLLQLWAQNSSNALETLKNSVTGKADDIFRELMQGYDLTNWNDKTLSQIDAIAAALESVEVPDSIKEMLKDSPELLEALEEALKELANKKLENTVKPERFKKLASSAKEAANMVQELANEMQALSDSEGWRTLNDISNGLSEIADTASKATDSYSKFSSYFDKSGKGGWMSKVFSSSGDAGLFGSMLAVTVAANLKVLQLAAEESKKEQQIIAGLQSIHNTVRGRDNIKETMFGSSSIDELNQAANRVREISADIDKYRNDINSFQITTKHFGFWEKLLGVGTNENWRNGSLLPDLKRNITSIEGVFDKYGNLDASVLREILKTYPDLTKEEQDWINRAIEDSEAYEAAVKEVANLLSSVYGDIASQAADTIIDSWIEAGDAALDYADILDDIARRYAKMLLQDAILKKVLTDERADEIADKFVKGDVDAAMSMIASDMEKLAGMAPDFAQILSSFDPYFNKNSDESSSSVGAGIKGITEDTANLLAAYINAIRADVAMGNVQRGEILSLFKEYLNQEAAPSYAEYLARIDANTANILATNTLLLSELRSIITSESGLPAVRTLNS